MDKIIKFKILEAIDILEIKIFNLKESMQGFGAKYIESVFEHFKVEYGFLIWNAAKLYRRLGYMTTCSELAAFYNSNNFWCIDCCFIDYYNKIEDIEEVDEFELENEKILKYGDEKRKWEAENESKY